MSPRETPGEMSAAAQRPEASTPLVTIGMPVYNGADFIEEALGALLRQSLSRYRITVADNASTDGTWALLQQWAARDPRIRIHRHPRNLGAAANYRFLLSQAQTRYFMWHAYDDRLAPSYLERLVGMLEASPQCALACGCTVHLTPAGEVIRERPFPAVAELGRFARLRHLLRRPESSRIYGVYRTDSLRRAYGVGERFGYLWGADHLIVLSLMLDDALCGTNDTAFYWRRTKLSKERYRPNTLGAQLRFSIRYLRVHMDLLRGSSLCAMHKLLVIPSLLAHANRTIESFFQRPMRRAVRRLVKRGVHWARTPSERGGR